MPKKNILLVFLVSILLLSVLTINLSKVRAATQVSVRPTTQTVGQEGVPLPTSPFAINITVDNVADLFAWQIVLYYNSTILREVNATLPSGHVFEGKQIVNPDPFIDSDSKGTYIVFGASLYQGPTFSGSGVLCQIKFTCQTNGTSSLKLDITTDPRPGQLEGYFTELLDSNFSQIPFSMVNGQVTVVGVERTKAPSRITINVSSANVTTGSKVTISGEINVTQSNLEVIINYKVATSTTWLTLATNRTDANGHYIYAWNTTDIKANLYELKAKWLGDADYEGAESNIVPVTVNKLPSTISLSVHPSTVDVGSNVRINGTITPKRGSVEVKILYRRVGGTWTSLLPPYAPTVTTTLESAYSHSWKPTEAGSYELKTRWEGDDYTLPAETAESDVKTVEVTGGAAPPPESPLMAYLPYIIAAIAIIAIAAIGIYFLKIRKR